MRYINQRQRNEKNTNTFVICLTSITDEAILEIDLVKTSEKGIEIIKRHEGYSDVAYLCPAGYWTWGYGSRYYKGMEITKGMKFSKNEAEIQLKLDLEKFENVILKTVKVPLVQEQFDALVSFVYNVGETAFRNSTLLKKLNEHDYKGAEGEFLKWNKARDKNGNKRELTGLTKRRIAESELFAQGTQEHKETINYLAKVEPRGLDDKTNA